MRNQRENKENENDDEDDDRERMMKMKEMHAYTKVKNIYFSPPGKLAVKSNSFSCNLVQSCNLVRKLIPN